MWKWIHRLFSGCDVQEEETCDMPGECRTEDSPADVTECSGTVGRDSRTFDITACEDIEVEEIDGELH